MSVTTCLEGVEQYSGIDGMQDLPCMAREALLVVLFTAACNVTYYTTLVGAALLPAVGTCVVLVFEAVPGR